MKFIVYWKHGKSNAIEGNDITDAFTKAGYRAGAAAAIDFYSNTDEPTHTWNKANKNWEPKVTVLSQETENKVKGKTCLQFLQWVFRDWFLDVFKSFDPIPKGESAKDLSNSEIRRLFQSKCIEINGDFFEAQEELPPIVYSLVLFPNNQRMRNTLI